MFRKTIIPISYLPTAGETLRWGVQLTCTFHSDLTVLYTAPPAKPGPLHASLTDEKMAEWGVEPANFRLLREAEEVLRGEGALQLDEKGRVVERHSLKGLDRGLFEVHLRGRGGENVRLRLREGRVVNQILKEVEDPTYDLIFIGTRGRRGLRRQLLGDIAQEVALHAPCSVLVAKQLNRVQQVLVGITGRESSLEALRQAAVLAQSLDLPLRLIAVHTGPEDRGQAESHLEAGLEVTRQLGFQASRLLVEGEATQALLYHAGSGTLLSLGRTPLSMVQRFFLGDLSLKILDQGQCSVLIATPPRWLGGEEASVE